MEKKTEGKGKTNQEAGKHGLLDKVFSWTSNEILNKYLYINKVKKIPMVFPSSEDYLNSFKVPLVEETHADLTSSMKTIARSPAFEITSIEFSINFKPREDLLYVLQPKSIQDVDNKALNYEPEAGDLIVITNVWPVKDLRILDGDYTIALIKSVDEDYPGVEILASKPFLFEQDMHNATKDIQSMYATYLINLTTNLRIWKALHLDPNGENAGLIKTVLRPAWTALENCAIRTVKKKCSISAPDLETMLRPFDLNNSQLEAVLSCIATRDDSSTKHNIKLIWGPPGTGKTKTVGSLLFVLLKIKCRTLTCAPTNTAVLEVAGRVLKLVRDSLQIGYGNYGLGDLVLLGNGKRMKVHDRDDQIVDIFLSERIKILEDCLAPLNGWKDSLKSMIALLEDPEDLYRLYLESCVVWKQQVIHEDKEAETDSRRLQDNTEKGLKNIDAQTIKKGKMKLEDAELFTNNSGTENAGNREDGALSFEEFIMKRFISISGNLKFCIVGLYSHLPTSSITLKVVKRMITACDLLESLKTLMHDVYTGNEGIKEIFSTKNETKGIKRISNDATLTGLARMRKIKEDCLITLTFLRDGFNVPRELDKVHLDRGAIVNFCMANALFIFSTVSSSIKLDKPRMKKIELLVIDEAAQLKECESIIPLQLPGVRRAILVGDERQLSAILKSEICEKADFGRSLFQRLVALGHKKHLLNVQYRMHPSISFFPNKVFYYNEILDAPMVKSPIYSRDYLGGKFFGSYSFINISHGQEELGYGRSLKNLVEVAVISELVAQLFEESMSMKRMTSIGIISPYNAQVLAIQEKLGNTYTKSSIDSETYFSLSVRSIDGFQGGEEDLIIMSTVRCNDKGLIGFLSNRQRTNVALTRARYCLWILGNEPTLTSSKSVWGTLVADAKERKCFHNADEDTRLDRAITNCLIELNRFDILPGDCYQLFRSARWKVSFSDEFRQTMVDTYNIKTRRQVFSLLVKLSTGWRNASKESQNIIVTRGNISQLLELYKVCISDDFDESMIKTYDIETLGQVFSLLQKLSTGWRNAGKASQNNIVTQGENSQLLELYKVNELLYIAWTEEILEEDSDSVPVLKFWDLLPVTQLSKLRNRLDMLRSEFTCDTMYICKFNSFDKRNLEVPLNWPAKVNDVDKKKLPQAKLEQLLLKPMASLDISNNPGESSTSYRVDNKKKNAKVKKKSSLKGAVRIAQIPVSETHLGHVVNVPAEPINGGGEITASELQLVESSSQHTVRAAPKKKQVKKAGNKL